MARYDYICAECGVFEAVRPIGTAGLDEPCPACGRSAGRVFSPPALTSPGSPLRRAREVADSSAHEPRVTGRPSSRPPQARPPNPLQANLPRP